MALARLKDDLVYRWYLASKLAFADIAAPKITELNANPTNDPSGLIWNLSCALNTDGSQFDLDDPNLDESLTFCQKSGDSEVLSRSATVVFNYNMAKQRWLTASSTLAANGFNQANLAHSLLAWRGVDYYAVLAVGKSYDTAFVVNEPVKIVEVSTDVAIPDVSSGSMIKWTQTMAKRTDIAWNVRTVA